MERDLCGIDDVVERVPGYQLGDDDRTEGLLGRLIAEESRDFLETTGREITAREDEQPAWRLFDLDVFDVEERLLEIGDAASIAAVRILDGAGAELQQLASGAWVERPRRREDWEPITHLTFPLDAADPAGLAAGRIVRVQATWGFPAVPETVRRAVAALVLARYLVDTAAAGTRLSEALNREEVNLAGMVGSALDVRRRFRDVTIG